MAAPIPPRAAGSSTAPRGRRVTRTKALAMVSHALSVVTWTGPGWDVFLHEFWPPPGWVIAPGGGRRVVANSGPTLDRILASVLSARRSGSGAVTSGAVRADQE